jgi:hypothetical protein
MLRGRVIPLPPDDWKRRSRHSLRMPRAGTSGAAAKLIRCADQFDEAEEAGVHVN